jgi:type IV fimbrial biogenesis protein FimT
MSVLLHKSQRRLSREEGYTLVELLMTCAIIAVVGGMAAGVSASFVNRSKADGAVQAFMTVLEVARTRAIAERRNFFVTFIAPNRVTVQREEIVNGVPTGLTTITNATLDNQLIYKKYTGLPDTPDQFGAAASIDFDGTGPVAFTSDGSLVDSAGDLSNGTIFLGTSSNTSTEAARAVTVMGATGLIKSFAWGKTQWIGQ